MRIAFDISAASPQRTGIGTYALELARHLVGLEGHEWTLLFNSLRQPPPDDPALRAAGVRWRRTRIPGPALLYSWKWFDSPSINRLIGASAEVFHSPSGFIPPQTTGARVATVHDLDFLNHAPADLPALGSRYLRWALDRRINDLDAIICVSHRTADQLREAYAAQSPDLPDRIHVISHGVDPRFGEVTTAEHDAEIRARHALPVQPGYILYVGDRSPRKNLRLLTDAVRQLHEADLGAPKLVLAGPRHRSRTASKQRMILPDRVMEIPYVPVEALPALYRGAGVFAMPSIMEGFGMPILEAMASGVPVVTTQTAGVLDFLPPDTVLAVPPTDADALSEALKTALAGGTAIATRVVRARAAAGQFTWQRTAEATLEAYRAAADRAANRAGRTISVAGR